MLEKDKMLITSFFSFCNNVLYSIHTKSYNFSHFQLLTFTLILGRTSLNLSSARLSLYYTMTTFDILVVRAFWKHCEKRRKCWLLFPQCFFFPVKEKLDHLSHYQIVTCKCFQLILDKGKILLSGRGSGGKHHDFEVVGLQIHLG